MTYGITVERGYTYNRDTMKTTPNDCWRVYLPHQCDEWTITDEQPSMEEFLAKPTTTVHGTTHEAAIGALEAFIAEAQDALAALLRREEYGLADLI